MTRGAVQKAAKRFASDIRELRERRQISLSDVHRQTRISEGILTEFESDGLITNQLFNRVYLRSLVVTYARVIGIDESESLEALESVLAGEYDGSLLRGDQGDRAPPEDRSAPVWEDEKSESTGGSRAFSRDEEERPDPVVDFAPELGQAPVVSDHERVARRFEFEGSTEAEEAEGSGAPSSERVHTEISTAIHDFVPPEEQRGLIVRPHRFRALALTTLVIVVSVSAIVMALRISERSDVAGGSSAEASQTEGQRLADARPPDPIPVPRDLVVRDSIAVTLVAARGALDPVRIQVDQDLRRPYWVENGDSITFAMERRIVVQDLLERLDVRVEGVPYPLDQFAGRERVEINRDSVESFVRSLTSR